MVPLPELIQVDAIDSNMDALHARAAAGAPDGTAMAAVAVTRARGARGRIWHAPPGGLWLSVLRRSDAAAPAAVLSLRVGLAVAAGLAPLLPRPLALKWPNDLILDGRKIGGILCELRWHGNDPAWIVIGLGLNVENDVPAALRDHATTIAYHAPEVTLAQVRAIALAEVRQVDLDRPRLDDAELAAFAARDWLAGRAVLSPRTGTCRGISGDGALRVKDAAGAVHFLQTSEHLALAPVAADVTPPPRPA